MHQLPRAVVIPVSYGSHQPTIELLDSLQMASSADSAKIFVVDNGSAPGEVDKVRSLLEGSTNAELLESASNRGYFGAARFALDHYLGNGQGLPDWVIVCNHDILIEDKEFFTKLFRQNPETVGVIAPRIQVQASRLDQNPFMRRRPGRLRWAQFRLVSSYYPVAAVWDWLWRRKAKLRSRLATLRRRPQLSDDGKRERVYAAHGSFFIFSRKFFEAGGFLDSNLFLYGEEISVAEMCRSLELPIVYEPSLCVVHNEHQSTGRRLSRFTFECQKNAMQYISVQYLSNGKFALPSADPRFLTKHSEVPEAYQR